METFTVCSIEDSATHLSTVSSELASNLTKWFDTKIQLLLEADPEAVYGCMLTNDLSGIVGHTVNNGYIFCIVKLDNAINKKASDTVEAILIDTDQKIIFPIKCLTVH